MHEWEQVPTRKHIGLDAEAFASDTALQPDGEEAIVGSGQDANWRRWPRREVTHRVKRDVGLGPLVPLSLGRDLGVDVVQKVGSQVEGTVSTPAGGLLLSLERPGVCPPVAGALTRNRDHRVHQHQVPHRHPFADQRGREPSQRPGHEHHLGA